MRIAIALMTAVLSGCFGDVTDLGGAERPDAKTVDVKGILSQWSGCMTMPNFQAANMTSSWSTMTTNSAQQCVNCHDGGQFGFMASDDEAAFFAGISQHSSLMKMYFTVDLATEKVIVNTSSFASANGKTGHPKFNTMNAGMAALETFYAATAANTVCETSKMLD